MHDLMLDHDSTPQPQRRPRPVLLVRPAETAGQQRPVRPPRPALLAGEDLDAPDQHIFRGTD